MNIIVQIAIILLLILANGAFAMSEIAVLSANKNRLKQAAEDGDVRARVALDLAEAPNRFLSTVQIGITLIGVLNGAISGATIGAELGSVLARIPLLEPYAEALGVGAVVVLITYFTLLLGELAPKRLALNNPTRVALTIARPMHALSRIAAPLVRLLSFSLDGVLSLLRVKPSEEPDVTLEDVAMLIEQGTHLGIIEPSERDIAARLFRLDDVRVSLLMTPRPDVVWLDINDSPDRNRRKMVESGRSYFPVGDGSLDNTVGLISVKDVWASHVAGEKVDLMKHISPPLFIPESVSALDALNRMKAAGTKRALVINEFGGLEGMVTVDDLLEAMVGYIQEPDEEPGPEIVQREDGSWLIDARLPADELKELFDLDTLRGEEESGFETVGGFVMMALGDIPDEADQFEYEGLRFEVLDMDGYRVDKVLVTRIQEPGDTGRRSGAS